MAGHKGASRLFASVQGDECAHDYDSVLSANPEQAVSIPKPNYNPPFNVTRASHAVLHVKDLGKSRAFYVDLIGFIVSDEDKDAIYLRGVAEACHHSLVLKRAAQAASRAGRACAASPRRIWKRRSSISRKPGCRRNGWSGRIRAGRCT